MNNFDEYNEATIQNPPNTPHVADAPPSDSIPFLNPLSKNVTSQTHNDELNQVIANLLQDNENLTKQLESYRMNWITIENRFKFLEKNYIENYNEKDESTKDLNSDENNPNQEHRITQTWDNIICEFCSKTQTIVKHENFKNFLDYQNGDYYCVKADCVDDLERKFSDLRDKLIEYEKHANDISELEENVRLKAENVRLGLENRELSTQCSNLIEENEEMERIISKLNLNGLVFLIL